MPIPEIADFENILSRIRLLPSKPSDGAGARSVQLPLHLASDEKGNVSHDTLWLAYPTDTKISFERLLDRIARDLSVIQHPNQRDFTLFVLAFSSVIPVQAEGHVARLNTILACICDADVNLYFILAAGLPDCFQYKIPPFRFGRIRADKFKYNCDKAGSDFYERYKDALREAWVVEREPMPVKVFEIPRIREWAFERTSFASPGPDWRVRAWEALVNGYFSLRNRFLFDEFWD